jgi:spermidine/putrescine transport system permease protein
MTTIVRSRRAPRNSGSALFLTLMLTFLFAPLVLVVLFSFSSSPRSAFPPTAFTLGWYADAFADDRFLVALQNSVVAALASALFAGLLGTTFALGLVGMRGGRRNLIMGVTLLPAILPGLLIGIALSVFFLTIGVGLGLPTAIIGHALIGLPFVIMTMNARMEGYDHTVLEAARDLGATPLMAFRDITFPLIRPSILGAMMLVMAISLDEFIVTFFTVGSDQTLPVLIWAMLRRGIDPAVNAIATLIIVGTVGLTVVAGRWARIRL